MPPWTTAASASTRRSSRVRCTARRRRRRDPRRRRRAPGRDRQDGHAELQPVPPRVGAAPKRRRRRHGGESMRLEGERRFEAPRATVWRVLNDPASMARTMPGIESFDVADDRHWKAHVKIPLGLGGLRMSVSFEKTEEHEPDYAKLHAKGDGVGAIMNMDTAFHLEDAEGGGKENPGGGGPRAPGPTRVRPPPDPAPGQRAGGPPAEVPAEPEGTSGG